MEPESIYVKGAREHNLKGITLEIPKKKLVVFTGVSGSGKSSLAFDTLYAEGQRRYVESLSAYARQFLGQMEKPHYDVIRGLSPTISIEQKAASNNPRSTVGTITEIHDYMRVLFAAVGKQHCTTCGRRVGKQSAQQIAEELMRLPEGTKLTLLAPLIEQRKGEHKEVLADARKRGFARARVDGVVRALDEDIELDKKKKHDIQIVVDRLVVKAGDESRRLTDSVETALREGKGVLHALTSIKGGETHSMYSEHLSCPVDGISFPELAPHSFSFNNPLGMCQECNGLGTRPEMDADLIIPDKTRTIRGGAVEPWNHALERGGGWTFRMIESLSNSFKVPLDKPWKDLPTSVQQLLLVGSGDDTMSIKWSEGGRTGTYKTSFEGIIPMLMRRFKETTSESMRKHYLRYFSDKDCSSCNGERLRPESRAVSIGDVGDTPGKSIVHVSRMTIDLAMQFLQTLPLQGNDAVVATELIKEISNRLRFLLDVGLGYLTLDRPGPTLSGGESQRIRLASQMGSELTGVIYILDEPSIGLHQRDNARLLATLKRLRDLGNSVIVVEHDEETMEEADWIVDFGPGAGELGGEIVAEGTPRKVMAAGERSLTAGYLSGRRRIDIPAQRRRGNGLRVSLKGASANNLKNVDMEIPLGCLVAVSGVSGAGKSTLVNGILYPALSRALYGSREAPGTYKALAGIEHLDKVIEIDQKPIGRTPRSNPATYTKVFDFIRDVFARTPEARAYGYEPGRFSFNVKGGRCEACEGDGMKVVEMHFLADVYVPCEVCHGKRFNDATLRVTFKGKNIAEVLNLSVREAIEHFSVHKEIIRILKTLDDVGLGYIKIGQPSPSLSGGEAQRIKLSRELARTDTGRTLYVLDEPTTGLHFEDIRRLLVVLNRLVDAGNTVLVIEHNLDVIKCADHIIDVGPEGGDKGGHIIAVGTPEQVAQAKGSYTGQYLDKVLGRARVA